jgi:zinc protease
MRTTFLPALALGMVLATVARADDLPKIPHEKYVLPNGLEVILVPDRSVPLVEVNLWYHVGSGDEDKGKSGFAHLFEHMMFQGAKHIGEDVHFKILEAIGGSGVNGSTNSDRTNYYQTIPSNHLETALWLESDRMGYLLETVTQKSLDNQRDVVKNERRQSYETRPYALEQLGVLQVLYPEGHPHRYSTIGRHEDLTAASLDDVKSFFKKWYVPSNATLVIAGDFDVAEGKKLVEKWFGSFPKLPKPVKKNALAPKITAAKTYSVEDPFARLRRYKLTWHSPKIYSPGDAELDILAFVLGAPGTGRLYRRLVLDTQLATNVAAYQVSQRQSSIFVVQVDLKPGSNLDEVKKIVDDEIGKVRTEPVTDKEIARARVNIESDFVWGLESLHGRVERLQAYNDSFGRPDGFAEDLARYRNATAAGLQKVAEKYLAPTARVESLTMPKGGAK